MKKELKSFVEKRAEKLLKETCGDFNYKYETWLIDKAHETEVVLLSLQADVEQADLELVILEELEPKLKKFIKEKRAELKAAKAKLGMK